MGDLYIIHIHASVARVCFFYDSFDLRLAICLFNNKE